uniref:Uncharacterized protein n=1 Tax=Knipowitschia caucasica TaxID=637954 RepID=A0AAV2JFQ2_KNICA
MLSPPKFIEQGLFGIAVSPPVWVNPPSPPSPPPALPSLTRIASIPGSTGGEPVLNLRGRCHVSAFCPTRGCVSKGSLMSLSSCTLPPRATPGREWSAPSVTTPALHPQLRLTDTQSSRPVQVFDQSCPSVNVGQLFTATSLHIIRLYVLKKHTRDTTHRLDYDNHHLSSSSCQWP